MKHKSLSQMHKERDLNKSKDEEYQGGKAYRVMLDMFRKNKKKENKNSKTMFTFKLLNLIKKCKEKGKFQLAIKLIDKYKIDKEKLGEAYYD